jgi:flagellar hook-basal body complex protein FliE
MESNTMGTELAGLIRADLAALTNQAEPPVGGAGARRRAALCRATNKQFLLRPDHEAGAGRGRREQRAAGEKMAAVDSGKSDDLVGAMLSSQQASLSFSMLMQVRNKVMGAVDELLKLPV